MKGPGITPYQFGVLVTATILATNILFIPSNVVREAGEMGWITLLVAGGLDIAVGGLLFYLGRKFPEKDFIQYAFTLAGVIPGAIINFLFLSFLLLAATLSVRTFGDFITENYLPQTPPSFIIGLVVLVAGAGSFYGLESIARASELITPPALGLLLLILALVLPDLDLARLRPLSFEAVGSVLRASLVPASLFGECVIMGMLMPFVQEQRKTLLAKATAVTVAALVVSLLVAAAVGVFGARQTANFTCPLNQLTRIISIGGFLERLEALFMSLWMLTAYIKISIFLWVIAWGLRQWWKLTDYRSLLVPLGLVVALLAELVASSCTEIIAYLEYHPYLALPIEVGLTSLLAFLAWFRFGRKGGNKRGRLA